MVRKPRESPFGRVAYDATEAAIKDAQLAHKEIVACLEWLERGQLPIAVDRMHLAWRFIGEVLVREGRIEQEDLYGEED